MIYLTELFGTKIVKIVIIATHLFFSTVEIQSG